MDLGKLILLIIFILKACNSSEVEREDSASFEEAATEEQEENIITSDYYIDRFSEQGMDSLFNREKELVFISVNNFTEFDSTINKEYGYEGSVVISNKTKGGFDFQIDVWNIGHAGGDVEGHASFKKSNLALFEQAKNDTNDYECYLSFIFYRDTLFVEENSCIAYHGAAAAFGDTYVLERKGKTGAPVKK